MKTINVTKYGSPHPADMRLRYFLTVEQGKETAAAVKFKDEILAGAVNIEIHGLKERGHRWSGTTPTIREGWIKGFFGPVAREVGIDLMFKNLSINGENVERDKYCGGTIDELTRYLLSEEKRMVKEAKKKARKTGNTTWSESGKLLIPDIGTVLRLTDDWTFRLYTEGRNVKLLKAIGKKTTDWGETLNHWLVVIPAGSELGVDRVYIRRGAGDFSSITFNLHKGSTIVLNGDAIKTFGRFWAKLSDVNQMKVEIDLNSLAGN